jgi:UDP-N-acetylmuramate dehydrogenase
MIVFLQGEKIPYLVVGRGSNLLVKDEGLEGLAILLRGTLAAVAQEGETSRCVEAGAGLGIGELLGFCRRSGLTGLEFLAGIPGTVGGALAMNAGAFGGETGDRVRQVRALDPEGALRVMDRSGLRFSYRKMELERGTVILGGCFELAPDSPAAISRRMASFLKRRKETQPVGMASAGSVFKNPPGDYAGRLMEQVGLKGESVGGAMISRKHANYIVNRGGASAGDILALMERARKRVQEATGIILEPEIRVVGR